MRRDRPANIVAALSGAQQRRPDRLQPLVVGFGIPSHVEASSATAGFHPFTVLVSRIVLRVLRAAKTPRFCLFGQRRVQMRMPARWSAAW